MTKARYITIQEWMLDLGIGGNDLLAYALVWGFCQDGKSCFRGSLEYVARWLGVNRRTAIRVMQRLQDLQLVTKSEVNIGGVKLCEYVTTGDKFTQGVVTNSHGGGDNLSPNNKDINIYNNKIYTTPKFNFRQSLIAAGISAETADQWLQVRKFKRLANTEIALKDVLNEISKTRLSAEECIRECVARSWGGFKAVWLERERNRTEPESDTMYMWRQMQRSQQQSNNTVNDYPDEQ